MHTRQRFNLHRGLGLALWFGSGATLAAAGDDGSAALFWLAGLPGWVLPAVLALVFMGLSWAGLMLLRRRRPAPAHAVNRAAPWLASGGGALLGVALALAAAGPWQDWLLGRIAALPPTGAVPQAAGPRDLLDLPDADGKRGLEERKSERARGDRTRRMKVNLDVLDSPTLNLNLFDDTTLVAVRDRVVQDMKDNQERRKQAKGGMVWVGHIQGYEDNSQVILAVKGQALMGTVELDGHTYEIVYKDGDTHTVRELDLGRLPPKYEPEEHLDIPLETDAPAAPKALDATGGDTAGAGGDTSTTTTTGGTAGNVIDLMVLYTPAALANAGSVDAMAAKILNAVTRTNQAYLNSAVDMQLNVVYMGQLNYTETGDTVTTLSRLAGKTDGFMDEVHALRNQYSADQVALISTDANYCGYAGIMTVDSTAAASSAFAVVHDDSVYNCLGNDTLAHELGHNQGNVHNPEDTGVGGAYPYAYGYRLCGSFRDIMSYPCQNEPRIPYFSNPNVAYDGMATGVTNVADTALSMNTTAATVAAFRVPPTAPPTAPANLAGVVTGATAVTLTWTDNAAGEIGYKVQGSLDGTNWAEIASLAENATTYVDSGLTPGATYSYRVNAYNSLGSSAYSNTATVQVKAGDTTAPVVKISNPLPGTKVGTTVSIKVTASDNVKLSSIKLYIDGTLKAATSATSIAYTWSTSSAKVGAHTIRADALDSSNNLGTASVSVTK